MTRAAIALLVIAIAGCGRSSEPAREAPRDDWLSRLPRSTLTLDLGQEPIVNPLNLWDLMIPGAVDHQVVGQIGDHRVTTAEIDKKSNGTLTRIGDRIYQARDVGWRALLEGEGLRREAARRHLDVDAMLLDLFSRLPPASDADLELLATTDYLRDLPAAHRKSAATTVWRWHQYRVMRSILVARGLEGVARERAQLFLLSPKFAGAQTRVGKIGDRTISRRDLHLASGYREQELRAEYIEVIEKTFGELVQDHLAAAAASADGITVAELEARIDGQATPSEADIDRYIEDNPDLAGNRELAADGARYARRAELRQAALAKARDSVGAVSLQVRQPEYERIAPTPHRPRKTGNSGAGRSLVIMHCFDTGPCALGAALAHELVDKYGDRVEVHAGDSFALAAPDRIRRALAVRCADEQQLGWALSRRLAAEPGGPPTLEALVAAGAAVGAREPELRACLASERLIPLVAEDVHHAKTIGLAHDVAGVWLDGERIYHVAEPLALHSALVKRLHP